MTINLETFSRSFRQGEIRSPLLKSTVH